MSNSVTNDLPLIEEVDDKFQRYNFSKRIAETITHRNGIDSIVIGLYGAWGEGKTTVLNFIRNEINIEDKSIVCLTFNPWRFPEETILLTSFFNSLANELMDPKYQTLTNPIANKSGNKVGTWFKKKKGHLKTDLETLGDILKEYGGLSSILVGEGIANTVGKTLSDLNVDTLKSRIVNLLKSERRRIVIFIDDIDRLDKDEIYSIFRLVKLTGDFPYTTYVLSFDEQMVASAISNRFGNLDSIVGENFLEKIIQVPLRLPLAQKMDLRMFCLNLVDKALVSSNVNLNEEEGTEFARKFSACYLSRLTTPRFAIRYCNAIAFSLPLMRGEVNIVDLMLVEALRIFFPEVYELIRDSPKYFLTDYSSYNPVIGNNANRTQILKDLFEESTHKYSREHSLNAQEAVQDLFPNLNRVWDRGFHFGTGTSESHYREKRICAQQYFKRYFSYSVIKGEIPDVAFEEFVNRSSNEDISILLETARELISVGSPDNFIDKIEHIGSSISSESAISLFKIMCLLGNYFSDIGSGIVQFFNPASQASLIASKLIRHQINVAERLPNLLWAISHATPFQYVYKIHNNCREAENDPESPFSEEQYLELNMALKNRALQESTDKPIWESFPYESKFIINSWYHQLGAAELHEYVRTWFITNPKSVISFLKMFTGPINSSNHPEPYAGDFASKHYLWLSNLVPVELVVDTIKQNMGSEFEIEPTYEILDDKQTDTNIMKQFLYCHIHPDKKVEGLFG